MKAILILVLLDIHTGEELSRQPASEVITFEECWAAATRIEKATDVAWYYTCDKSE